MRHTRTFATALATGVIATAGVCALPSSAPVRSPRIAPAATTIPTIPVDRKAHGPLVTAALFGMHVLHSPTVWPNVPVTSERIWDDKVTWADIEPQPGVWDFTRLDQQIATARSHGASVVITLGQSPTWASSRPNEDDLYGSGAASPPASNAFWTQYVQTVAQRYAGQVLGYEIWNEPDWIGMWHGSPAQLATLTRLASQTIRAVDSKAKILSPSFVVEDKYVGNWLRGWINAGGNKDTDVLSIHGYAFNSYPPEAVLNYMNSFRSILANHHISQPIWDTEATSGRKPNVYSASVGGGMLARSYLLSTWLHKPRLYWYAWDDYDFGGVQLTTKSGQGTSVRTDYRSVYNWVVNARERSCAHTGQLWSCTFARSGHLYVAAWARSGTLTAKVPRGFGHVQTLHGVVSRVRRGQNIKLTGRPLWFKP